MAHDRMKLRFEFEIELSTGRKAINVEILN